MDYRRCNCLLNSHTTLRELKYNRFKRWSDDQDYAQERTRDWILKSWIKQHFSFVKYRTCVVCSGYVESSETSLLYWRDSILNLREEAISTQSAKKFRHTRVRCTNVLLTIHWTDTYKCGNCCIPSFRRCSETQRVIYYLAQWKLWQSVGKKD